MKRLLNDYLALSPWQQWALTALAFPTGATLAFWGVALVAYLMKLI